MTGPQYNPDNVAFRKPTPDVPFHLLDLPADAEDFLSVTWDLIQSIDDKADDDPFSPVDLAINSMVRLPANPFYQQHVAALAPMIATQIAKWHAANELEVAGHADHRSFIWRAGYYDLVLCVCGLVHGATWQAQNAEKVLSLYGESFEAYKEEMKETANA